MVASPDGTPTPPGPEVPARIEWLGSADAADYLGVGQRTLYKFIDDGDLPGYRMGRVIRLKRADLDAFIESRRIRPGTLEHLRADAAPAEGRPTD